MRKIIALFRSEFQKNKSSYLMPVWIIAGMLAVSLIAALVARFALNENVYFFSPELNRDGLRIGLYGIMFAFSLIFFMFLVLTAQSSLNREKQLGSDLFFRCQPVSAWRVTGVKYIMHVYAASLVLAALGIIMALVLSFAGLFTGNGFPVGSALYGVFLGWIAYVKVAMVLGSLLFLFSAVFRSSALLKGAAALGILEGLFAIIEAIFRHRITLPDVFATLFSLMGDLGVENMDSISMNMLLGNSGILFALVFAALCYTGATVIYKMRSKDV